MEAPASGRYRPVPKRSRSGARFRDISAVQTHTHGVLDTNAVILLPRLTDQKQLPHVPAITAITLAELSVGPHLATTETEREARRAHLQQAEADFKAIPFDAAAARAFGQVAAD